MLHQVLTYDIVHYSFVVSLPKDAVLPTITIVDVHVKPLYRRWVHRLERTPFKQLST